jgi:hypothetical protein
MAAPPPPLTGANQPAVTYSTKYRQDDDALHGNYTGFYDRHEIARAATGVSLLRRLIGESELVPKVFLFATTVSGVVRIDALHRVAAYRPHPFRASPWDGHNYAFVKDVVAGSFVKTVELPADPFEMTTPQLAPTIGDIAAQLAAHPDEPVIPPLAAGAANSEDVTTRRMIQVPLAYVPLVLLESFTPRRAWDELAGAIFDDGRDAELSYLVDWLRVTLTQ